MSDMAVDMIQSAKFELNKVIALHYAQTNPAIVTEQKRTRILANRKFVGYSVGLALQCPKMQGVLWWIQLGQHFVTAQFHQIASTLVDVKRNIFIVKASTNEGPVSADDLPLVRLHIFGRSPSLLLEFSCAIGSRCGLGTFGIRTDSTGPAIASNSDWRIKHGAVRLLDNGDKLVIIHIDEALVTNHSTSLK
jgi:hypothetical protein